MACLAACLAAACGAPNAPVPAASREEERAAFQSARRSEPPPRAPREEATFAAAAPAFEHTFRATDAGVQSAAADSTAPPAPVTAPGTAPGTSAAAATTAMLIRTGQASVEVDSLEPAVARVRALAARLGGYVGNTVLAAGRDQVRAATLELKIPAARFDDALTGLAPLGRVDSVTTGAQDVGEEFVDVSARMANARRLEARLLALLDARTGRLADVLSVERELARVREEVERSEGRLRYLRTRAATSTLAITVHERPPLVGTSPARSPVGDAVRQAWRNFVGLVAVSIAASGVLVPLALVGWVAWVAAGRVRRRATAAGPRPAAGA
jgi:hypothetical protein